MCWNNLLLRIPDLTALTELKYLNFEDNQITELPDLSRHTKLTHVRSKNNFFVSSNYDRTASGTSDLWNDIVAVWRVMAATCDELTRSS
jgi:Leucine-rich repeat (LRR) protein